MANEITCNIVGTLVNGQVKDKMDTGPIQVNQTNARFIGNIQDVGTSAENITFGDLTSPGYVRLRNLDPTNYMIAGPDVSGSGSIYLPPLGLEQLIYIPTGVTWQAKANTATCKLSVKAWDK